MHSSKFFLAGTLLFAIWASVSIFLSDLYTYTPRRTVTTWLVGSANLAREEWLNHQTLVARGLKFAEQRDELHYAMALLKTSMRRSVEGIPVYVSTDHELAHEHVLKGLSYNPAATDLWSYLLSFDKARLANNPELTQLVYHNITSTGPWNPLNQLRIVHHASRNWDTLNATSREIAIANMKNASWWRYEQLETILSRRLESGLTCEFIALHPKSTIKHFCPTDNTRASSPAS